VLALVLVAAGVWIALAHAEAGSATMRHCAPIMED